MVKHSDLLWISVATLASAFPHTPHTVDFFIFHFFESGSRPLPLRACAVLWKMSALLLLLQLPTHGAVSHGVPLSKKDEITWLLLRLRLPRLQFLPAS